MTLHSWQCGRGTVLLGFEQTNKYTVLDQDGTTVALMAEDTGGLGTAVGRQLMKRRRSFTATVFSPDGGALHATHSYIHTACTHKHSCHSGISTACQL